MARPVHAPHPRGTGNGHRFGESAAGVAGRQSDGVLRQIFPLAAPLADYLCEVRHDVPAGIFGAGGRGIREAQPRSQSRRAALRALHHGGDSVQIHGWLAAGELSANGVRIVGGGPVDEWETICHRQEARPPDRHNYLRYPPTPPFFYTIRIIELADGPAKYLRRKDLFAHNTGIRT